MSLLNGELSIWEIGFRWAGYDPDKVWIRPPLPVRDNFRTLIHSILHCHLECDTLILEKWEPDTDIPPEDHIHHYLKEVFACINGENFDRGLLRHAIIQRYQMQEWCERHKIPLPEFWFQPGWGIEYEWPDDTSEEEKKPQPGESLEEKKVRLNENHRWQMACKQISIVLWTRNPKLTIKEVALSTEVQELSGGKNCELDTVQGWIKEFDPRSPSKKRGRKRKNNTGSENSDQLQPSEK